jgi:pyruvate/2-oxoglutarate dehydrogenase complex dihydrolipoamide acyltransferase (E2) component
MYVFELPEVGEGVVEAEVVRWFVSEGETVSKDQRLCEIMTDKATIEIPSPRAGTIAKLHGTEGDVIRVHEPLVDIDENGASAGEPAPAKTAPAKAAPAVAVPAKAVPAVAVPAKAVPAAPVAAPRTPGKTLASPAVRSHARSAGVDIDAVSGTGKDGRVTRADIDTHGTSAGTHSQAIKAPPAIQVPPSQGGGAREDQTIKIIGLRRKIAEKMVESYQRVPHFTYVDEVDMTALVELRTSLKPTAAEKGVRLTYLPFIMKALCVAFRTFPTVNATMDEESFSLIVRGSVNIGIATDTDSGLVVPVVKAVESQSIWELAANIADLTDRTRAGQARLDELQGGTFTITSVGNIGGRFATPIINNPEVAILGVNQIHERPMVVDGEIVIRKMMYLSPSFDHRVLDGAVAARFVSHLKAILENPAHLLAELR